jgi:hypothetical protein
MATVWRTSRLALKRGWMDIFRDRSRSCLVVLSVSNGVGLAIAIIAAANGSDEHVRELLQGLKLPPQIDVRQIHETLGQARDALTYLAYAFSAFFVGLVTWISMEDRRYHISASLAKGFDVHELMIEYVLEASILCMVGGLVGIGVGYLLCLLLPSGFSHLPMHFHWNDALHVFPTVSVIAFLITLGITLLLSFRPILHPEV